jgi:hypothetical protein
MRVSSGHMSRCSIKSQARHTNQNSSVSLDNHKRSDLLSAVSDRKPPLCYVAATAILTYASPPELSTTARSEAMASSSSSLKTEGMN